MNSVEITITKMHLIYAGAVMGIFFLSILVFWARKFLIPILVIGGLLAFAASIATWQIRESLRYRKVLQAQVEELPPDFRVLYTTIENCRESEVRKLAVTHFMAFRNSDTAEKFGKTPPLRSDKDAWISPFQYEAFLRLASSLNDVALREHIQDSDWSLENCVQFGFELE